MSEIQKWLEMIGLAQYADAFDTNAIDMKLLRQVDDQILKDIGVSAAGHRMRIRNAIAKLGPAPVAEVNLSPPPLNMRPLPRLRSAASSPSCFVTSLARQRCPLGSIRRTYEASSPPITAAARN
jgi:hypothetical protein